MLENLPLNWGLLRNPMNWITVLLMVFIGGIAFDLAHRLANKKGLN